MIKRNLFSIFQRVWQIEASKFKKRGFKDTITALFILFIYFYSLPTFIQPLWPQKIQNKFAFQFTTSYSIHIISTIVFSVLYLPGYFGVQAYKKYQIEPLLKKPWQKQNWEQMSSKTFWNLIFNYFIVLPVYIYIVLLVGGCMESKQFPTPIQLAIQMFVILAADDFIQMVIHWIFHNIPSFYPYHKVHHEHDSSPFCLANEYIHPVDQVIGNFLPGTIVFSLCNVHIIVYLMWLVIKLYTSIESHSGYEFPWSPIRVLPFIYGSSYHFFHHCKNVGNYSSNFYIFQLILGTNETFFSYELKKENIKTLKTK